MSNRNKGVTIDEEVRIDAISQGIFVTNGSAVTAVTFNIDLGNSLTLTGADLTGLNIDFLSGGSIEITSAGAVFSGAFNANIQVIGSWGDDVLTADVAGQDIFALAGDDKLISGTGIDNLFGGAGDDSYVFAIGSGHDVIEDFHGSNIIKTGANLNVLDFTYARSGDDLVIIANNNIPFNENWRYSIAV